MRRRVAEAGGLARALRGAEADGLARALRGAVAGVWSGLVMLAASAGTLDNHANAGMFDSGTTSRGFIRWARCHSSE